jgi:RNA polymerase sigma factor (TIGR02999 family)
MPLEAPSQITVLLKAWSGGDERALDRLIPLVYPELRRMARRYVRRGPAGQTLETTAVVHEAYLHLVKAPDTNWQDRAHFFAVAATVMRRILVDRARARASLKRGGQAQRAAHSTDVNFDRIPDLTSDRAADLVALDDALSAFSQLEPRRARVVELRFFGGLSVEETAEVLGISAPSVMRDWKLAKAWLVRELSR